MNWLWWLLFGLALWLMYKRSEVRKAQAAAAAERARSAWRKRNQ